MECGQKAAVIDVRVRERDRVREARLLPSPLLKS
jgi:hypothetical protein